MISVTTVHGTLARNAWYCFECIDVSVDDIIGIVKSVHNILEFYGVRHQNCNGFHYF